MIPVVIITSGYRSQIIGLVRELRHQSLIAEIEVHVVLHRRSGSLSLTHAQLSNGVAGLAHVWTAKSILSAGVRSQDHNRVSSHDFPVATARNAALVLARALGSAEAILLDDDVSGVASFFPDIVAIRRTRTPPFGPLILGARLTGASSSDRFTRLLGRLTGNEPSRIPIAVGRAPATFVSGGCVYVSFDSAALRPMPLQYNEFWTWCEVMRSTANCEVLLAPSSVLHAPETLPTKSVKELAIELEGIYLLKVLRAVYRSTSGNDKLQSIEELITEERFSPTRRIKHIEDALARYPQESIRSAALAVGIDPPDIDFSMLRSLLLSRLSAERVVRHIRQQIDAHFLQINAQSLLPDCK